MIQYLWAYGATLVAFLAIDLVWLGFIARNFYRDQLGNLMLDQPSLAIGLAFYMLFAVGIVVFAITPGLREGSWRTTLVLGALLGLIAYGTYDLTNLATLRNWPVMLSFVDMAWGSALTATSALVGYWAANAFGR
ncbi:MAG: DUF2177 family protein [Beijerinckiaceae bacterium]|nr:DUF2177 family protein [Beijerinckiaceae bacterium]MDO9441686.1 DUF2177 family protein [Beijerinckiaceae bacterium]